MTKSANRSMSPGKIHPRISLHFEDFHFTRSEWYLPICFYENIWTLGARKFSFPGPFSNIFSLSIKNVSSTRIFTALNFSQIIWTLPCLRMTKLWHLNCLKCNFIERLDTKLQEQLYRSFNLTFLLFYLHTNSVQCDINQSIKHIAEKEANARNLELW